MKWQCKKSGSVFKGNTKTNYIYLDLLTKMNITCTKDTQMFNYMSDDNILLGNFKVHGCSEKKKAILLLLDK